MGISFQYNPHLKPAARELRLTPNLPEIIMWKQLKNRKFHGLLFNKQKTIGNYIVDFCCEAKKVIIEVDGASHNDKQEADASRDAFLTDLGFRVLRVSTADVKHNMDGVLLYLESELKL